jgi:hypothetical protein
MPGLDRAGDDELADLDGLGCKGVVQHPGVGGLAGESDGGAGDLRTRACAGAAVGEQDRSAAETPHAGQHLPDRGDRAVDGELDGGGQVVDGGFQDRAQELRLRDRAVLENFDRPEVLGGPVQGGGQRLRVADISGVPAGIEAVTAQVGGKVVDVLLVAGKKSHSESLSPELAGDGGAQTPARADDGNGCHGFFSRFA